MKKDIETLIAEERAEIILKYTTVSSHMSVDGWCVVWVHYGTVTVGLWVMCFISPLKLFHILSPLVVKQ